MNERPPPKQTTEPATRSEYRTVRLGQNAHATAPSEGKSVTTVRCAVPEDQTSFTRETEPPNPTRVASGQRLVDEGVIAKGGMSSVHRVFDRLILRRAALKALRERPTTAELTRFIEEAQITGQLDHPNIVPVYDMLCDDNGVPARLAMKLVEGRTLHELSYLHGEDGLKGRLLEEMVQVLIKVCDAVAFAHSRGVIHRDLKPGNIMVGSHGQVYLMDWGIALVKHGMVASNSRAKLPTIQVGTPGGTEEAHGSLCGTPSYMAPEQALGLIDSIDERTDIYGLGGILYHMLTLRAPHDGGDVTRDLSLAKLGQVRDPRVASPTRPMPPGLCRIAMRALSADPDERYQNADEMKADLETFLRGGGWLEQRVFQRGTTIIEEGAQADAAYIITDGHCELHKTVAGERRFVRLMGAGEAFGETAIFGSTPRTATVIASTDVTLLVVTRQALEKELDRNVWVRSFVEAMAERFLELDRKATRLERELDELRSSATPTGGGADGGRGGS